MTTNHYDEFLLNPLDEIDAAVFSSDMFQSQENIDALRTTMARWERGLKEAEALIKASGGVL